MFFSKACVAGLQYVYRGDPEAYDYTQDTLSADWTWHTLNLSAIIPANAKLVHLRLRALNATVGKSFLVKKVVPTNGMNIVDLDTLVVSRNTCEDAIVDCTGQQIAYMASSGIWSGLGILVLGWFA